MKTNIVRSIYELITLNMRPLTKICLLTNNWVGMQEILFGVVVPV